MISFSSDKFIDNRSLMLFIENEYHKHILDEDAPVIQNDMQFKKSRYALQDMRISILSNNRSDAI